MTIVSSVIKMTDAGRSTMLASGQTNSEIDAKLQEINTTFARTSGMATTCASNEKTITSYLTDLKNGDNTTGTSYTINSSGQAVSKHTTSSGLVMECTQPAVSSSFTPAPGVKTN